jgi:hypothetical protein
VSPAVLALVVGCPPFASGTKGPPSAEWLGETSALPANTHLFVREGWSSATPPKTSFALLSAKVELRADDRVTELAGRGRLHELVPSKPLLPGSHELRWTSEGANEQRFAFTVGEGRDATPPAFDPSRAEPRDNPPDPRCGVRQAWRSASVPSARDDQRTLVYLVWRAGEDGLVDFASPPSRVVAGVGPAVDLGPIAEGWLGVAVIDAAGHRTEPRELPVGPPGDDPRARPARLWVKHASAWIVENPLVAGGVLFGLLVVVSFGFHRGGDATARSRRR